MLVSLLASAGIVWTSAHIRAVLDCWSALLTALPLILPLLLKQHLCRRLCIFVACIWCSDVVSIVNTAAIVGLCRRRPTDTVTKSYSQRAEEHLPFAPALVRLESVEIAFLQILEESSLFFHIFQIFKTNIHTYIHIFHRSSVFDSMFICI